MKLGFLITGKSWVDFIIIGKTGGLNQAENCGKIKTVEKRPEFLF